MIRLPLLRWSVGLTAVLLLSGTLWAQGFGPIGSSSVVGPGVGVGWGPPLARAVREAFQPVLNRARLLPADRDARVALWKYGLRFGVDDLVTPGWKIAIETWTEDNKPSEQIDPLMTFTPSQEQTGSVPLDQVQLVVGNEKGHALQTTTLRQVLSDVRLHLHDPASWSGPGRSLVLDKLENAVVTPRACFLPVVGETRFHPVFYPHHQQPVLLILASRAGTSIRVSNGFAWGEERLLFNNNGRAEGLKASAPPPPEKLGDAPPVDSWTDVLLVIQVPLTGTRGFGGFAPGSFGTWGISGLGGGTGQQGQFDVGLEINAFPGHGWMGLRPPWTPPDRFEELGGARIERLAKEPIRITALFWKPLPADKVTEIDVRVLAAHMRQATSDPEALGRVLLSDPASPHRAALLPDVPPLPWWNRFWKGLSRRTRKTPETIWQQLVVAHEHVIEWSPESPRHVLGWLAANRRRLQALDAKLDRELAAVEEKPAPPNDPDAPTKIEITVAPAPDKPAAPALSTDAVHSALEKRIDFSVRDVSTWEALQVLSKKIGVPIRRGEPAEELHDKALTERKTLELKNVLAESALEHLLSWPLDWMASEGGILLSGVVLRPGAYDVTGLGDPKPLVAFVTQTVDPDTWSDVGGAGSIASVRLGDRTVLALQQTASVHRQVRGLIEALRHLSRGKVGAGPWPIDRTALVEAGRRIEALLSKKISIDLKQKRLREAAAELGAKLEIPVQLDLKTFEDEGIDVETPVTLRLRDVSVRAVLKLLLEPLQCTYLIEDEVLKITTATSAGTKLDTRLFDVTGLGDANTLSAAVQSIIEPDTWETVGGPGSILPLKLPNRTIFGVRQTQYQLNELERLLAAFHQLKAGALQGEWTGATEEQLRFEKLLVQPVTVSLTNAPLRDVFDPLGEKLGLNIVLDAKMLEDEGIDPSIRVTVEARDEPFRYVLRKLLGPLKLASFIEDEVLKVTTMTSGGTKLESRLYNVSDLPLEDGQLPKLAERIDPDSWDRVGGSGWSLELKLDDKRLFIVRQVPPVHDQIRRLLGELRNR